MVSGKEERFITPLRLLGVLFLLVFVSFPDVVTGSHTFFYRDAGIFTYPLAYHCRESFWNGEVPLWNPLSNCGIPVLAQWNTVLCYPLSLIWITLPLPWSMTLFLLVHMFIGAWGMFRLAEKMSGSQLGAAVAGLIFAFNGLTIQSLMWASIIPALAWMPWIFIYMDKAVRERGRAIFAAAFFGALQMLTGSPEITFFTWGILVIYLGVQAFRKEISWQSSVLAVAAVVLLVTLLSAIQLFPFFELLKHANRTSGFVGDVWSMPPWGFANFLVPLFRTTPSIVGVYSQDEQQWTASYYLGIVTLLMAALAFRRSSSRHVYFLAGITTLGLLLSLGKQGYLYDLIRTVFPPIGFFRYPVKFVVLVLFALPLLAAIGVKRCEEANLKKEITGITAGLVLLGAAILVVAYLFPFPKEVWSATSQSGIVRICFLLVGAVLLIALSRVAGKTKALISYVLLVVIGWDVITHVPLLQPTLPTTVYRPMEFDMKPVPRFGESRAMLSPYMRRTMERTASDNWMIYYLGQRSMLLSNCNLLDDIPKVDGFMPLYLRYQSQIDRALYTGGVNPPLLDFLGVSQITTDNLFEWAARDGYLPLITGGQSPVVLPDEAIIPQLLLPSFNPRKQVYLSAKDPSEIIVTNASVVRIGDTELGAHRIAFSVDSDSAAMVVISQSYYPAWKAYVDGERVPLLRANHAFQALAVPGGKHRVEVRYEDTPFKVGSIISALSLIGCLAGFLWMGKRRKAARNSPESIQI